MEQLWKTENDAIEENNVRMNKELKDFYNSIVGIEKIVPKDNSHGATWIFEIATPKGSRKIKISNAQLMKGCGTFNNLYKSFIGKFLPEVMVDKGFKHRNEWLNFQKWIETICEETLPRSVTRKALQ
jgi:hypothetical protein